MLTKGIKTSELWVVLLMVASQFFGGHAGFDLGGISDGLTEAQRQVAEIARQLQAESGISAQPSAWLAMAYVVGRMLLKWRELGQGDKQ